MRQVDRIPLLEKIRWDPSNQRASAFFIDPGKLARILNLPWYLEELIAFALRQAETGAAVAKVIPQDGDQPAGVPSVEGATRRHGCRRATGVRFVGSKRSCCRTFSAQAVRPRAHPLNARAVSVQRAPRLCGPAIRPLESCYRSIRDGQALLRHRIRYG